MLIFVIIIRGGDYYCEKKVLDFAELKAIYSNTKYEIILSVNQDTIRKQLSDNGLPYWEAFGMHHNYFLQKNIQDTLDKELLSRYRKLDYYSGYGKRDDIWFREDYCSDRNKQLVTAMINKDNETISRIYSDIYGNEKTELYDDEYFINRPGMRLIANIIKQDLREKIKVCDFACGHGEFLKALKDEQIDCCGTDINIKRCTLLKNAGIECRAGDVNHSSYEDEIFDYVTMMECLEHIENPFSAMYEARRVLKTGGLVFVTTPYGTNCDSDTHIRQFYEDDLYAVASKCGFSDIKIMRLPYLDSSCDNNILMSARKIL